MRAVVTGQIGMDKKQYLTAVTRFVGERGGNIELFHVGDMMYAEGSDIRPGRILDLPLSRLTALRRAAFKDIIAATTPREEHPNVIINTHATFRWRHGLFSAIDFDQIQKFEPDMLICLVDNIEIVHHRLHSEHEIDATLKDCMVWREEEILATEMAAKAVGCHNAFYIVSRGRQAETVETCARLITRPDIRKVYPSFPMSHVVDMPEVLAEIDHFRGQLAKHFIAFDPGDVDEKLLLERAIAASREGKDWLEVTPHSFGGKRNGMPIRVSVREVLDIAGDVDGQIYMRDFKLIDQADMICSLIPELAGGQPGLSSGVERELQHAFEHTKEVYVVWKPRKSPSPFITETASKIFKSVDEALAYFDSKGMFPERDLFGNQRPRKSTMLSNQTMMLRFWGLIVLRAIALGMVVYGSVCLIHGLGIGIANYSGVQGLYYGLFLLYGTDNGSWLWFGVALLIPGLVLMMFSRRIVRWVIPVPAQECPKCGYELRNLTSASCPECGTALTDASAAADSAPSADKPVR